MENSALIMAGGDGTRLRVGDKPKQFIPFFSDGSSLTNLTYWRLRTWGFLPRNIYISTNVKYKNEIKNHVDSEFPLENIIVEPEKKNTASSLFWSMFEISKRLEEKHSPIFCVPADHYVGNSLVMNHAIVKAMMHANDDKLVIFGIIPRFPSTDYGYINKHWGTNYVKKFIEKPDSVKAQEYMEKGYYWNSGMFLWSSETFFKEILKVNSDFAWLYARIHDNKDPYDCKRFFAEAPSISIDYALLEKTDEAYCVPVGLDWCDLGTLKSLRERHLYYSDEVKQYLEDHKDEK